MRYIWLLTVLITSCVLYREAHAFDRCDAFLAGSSKIGAFLTEKVVHDEPLKFFDNARSIAIEIDPRSGRHLRPGPRRRRPLPAPHSHAACCAPPARSNG